MTTFISWLSAHLATCSFQQQLGVSCPGCGFQRALLELLKGNARASLTLYPALIPWLATLSLTVLHLVFRFEWGAACIKYLFLLTAALMLIKLINP